MARPILIPLLGSAVAGLAACPGSTDSSPVATTIWVSATSVTLDALGATQQLTASVLDQQGQAMNLTVSWSTTAATMTVSPSGNSATITALAAGPATLTVTAGALQATVQVQVTQVPVAPTKVSGDLQNGLVGSMLTVPLRVRVHDRLGAAIGSAPVSFAVTQGGGSVVPGSALTDAEGTASAQWVLGTAVGAAQQVTATTGNGLSVSFSAMAEPGAPAEISVAAGQGQTVTVGGAVLVPPAVLVRDAFGNPRGGIGVTFAVGSGGGSASGASAITSGAGMATVGGWILGTTAGPNTLLATVTGLSPVTFTAIGQPGSPATVAVQAGQGQSAPAGSPVPVVPAVLVRDGFGNPVPGIPVQFTVTGGGGTVSGAAAVTDESGIAAAGGWILGPAPGPNTLSATVAGLPPAGFTATGTAVPVSVAVSGGNNQSAPAGTAVPVPPSVLVRDAGNAPLAGVTVFFAVTGGGGSLTGASAVTNASGIAAVGSWTLGSVPGPNTLTATVTGLAPVSFTATGTGVGPPANVGLSAGNLQAALPGSSVAVAPAVLVRDASFQPVPGAQVSFAITRGTGVIAGANATTDAAGIATLGGWSLGPGVNCLTATVAGSGITGNPVQFVATGIPGSGPGYEISVQYLTCVTTSQETAFTNAVARWGAIITGDVADLPITNIGAGLCGSNSPAIVNRTLDDLLIFATIEPIDGPGAVLGSAGPCFIRTAGNLPVIGRMRFDIADVGNLEAQGRFTDVILHEMGHVLGIGTLWNTFGFLQAPSPVGGPAQDTHHNGVNALMGFDAVGGTSYTGGAKVPVENMFGGGTINAHWRESVLANELMTGFLNGGVANPLSALTVRSLADFNYVVDPAAADPFFLALALRAEGPPEVLIRLENDVIMGPLYSIDRNGRILRVR